MPISFKKIWTRDENTGNYYLPNLKSFLQEQEKEFPTMDVLYKHQMDLIKEDYPSVFA
ncbi:MAG: hypothetical protein U0K53_04985 [Paludibacteraceae bacterium]|jgi:hypothetical protein|nr:hypothetical protein [Paludibacteraceae bacterium]